MADQRKGPPVEDPELDDWMSAIDEWDASLDFTGSNEPPKAPGPPRGAAPATGPAGSAPNPASATKPEPAAAPRTAEPVPRATGGVTPRASGSGTSRATGVASRPTAAPVRAEVAPRPHSQSASGVRGATPSPPPRNPPPRMVAQPTPLETAAASATQARAETRGPTPRAGEDEPPPLEAAPGAPPPATNDPLMQLFDGDMELPEEAGEALGSLLGDGAAAAAAAAQSRASSRDEDDEVGTTIDRSFSEFAPPSRETTRVAGESEVASLLNDVDALAVAPDSSVVTPVRGPRGIVPPPAGPAPDAVQPHADAPPHGAAPAPAHVDADADTPVPERADAADNDGLEITEGTGVDELPPRVAEEPALAAGGSAAYEIDMEADFEPPPPTSPLAAAVASAAAQPRRAATSPAPSPPAVSDEEFYDDIIVEAGREESSAPRPVPVDKGALEERVSRRPGFDAQPALARPDPFAGQVPEIPSRDRASDPDRTPEPWSAPDSELFDSPGSGRAPGAPPPASRHVEPVRAPEPGLPLQLNLPERAPAGELGLDYLRDQLALLDTERLLSTGAARAVQLACAAGRMAEKLGDDGAALERYEAALEADPRAPMALRGARRMRLRLGQRDRAGALLDREIEVATPGERRALEMLRADLYAGSGERAQAAAAYRTLGESAPGDVGVALGLLEAAGSDAEESQALALLTAALGTSADTHARAAVAVARGRLDEAAGRYPDAVERYREALNLDAQAAGAVWGLYRVSLRAPAEADSLEAHVRLADLLPRGGLRTAVERRLGTLRERAGDRAAARPMFAAGADAGDPLCLRSLARLEQADGRGDEAAAALARALEIEPDAGRRADLLITLGELQELRGNTAQAIAAYSRAAAEYPGDPRSGRALERTQVVGDDKESALARHLRAAERDPARASLDFTQAARLLEELGRRDEALERVRAALAEKPALPPAVALAVDLELLAARPERAAEVLARAGESTEEPQLAAAFRERAARLWAKAGRPVEALGAIKPLLEADRALPLRWLEQRILEGLVESGEPLKLAENLRAEAEELATSDRARAADLWYRRGLLLDAVDPDAALESHKRALALDPGLSAAAVFAVALLGRAQLSGEIPAVHQARAAHAAGKPEQAAHLYRQAIAHADDANDFAAAQSALKQLVALHPEYAPARHALDRLARRAGDDLALVESLERELSQEESGEMRFAILLALGDRLGAGLGQLDRAAERYRQALELRPRHPLAAAALERSWRASKNYAALADLALSDLKEAPDARSKVSAYERLAMIDGELRGDAGSALLAYESIMEIDHAHHAAMRVLEKHYLHEQRWPELVALYEQMGLTATDPIFACAVHLDRARLRARLAGPDMPQAELDAAIDNDHRLALFKDARSRAALRHLLARARTASDLGQVAELSARLADAAADDGRTAAVCLTRSGDALVEQGRDNEARPRYEAAVARGGHHVPTLLELVDLGLRAGEIRETVTAAEQLGHTVQHADERARVYLLAGALAEEQLIDPVRALADLHQALAVNPRGPHARESFERTRRVLTGLGEFAQLADLYRARLEVETDGTRLVELHLELAKIARDRLDDRERARTELKAVLAQDAAHAEALSILAELYYRDEQWAEAADTFIKRARLERTREGLKDIFFKLGIIYSDKLPDTKRALACFTRVCKADPDDVVALEHLADLYMKEWDYQGALDATQRLAELEPDKLKKIGYLHGIARIYEEGFKDARHALEAYRAALELDPMHLTSVGELAKFFDRQSDVQSMRVHLDRTIGRARATVNANPLDPEPYHSLVKIFSWRRAPDRSVMAAGVLEWLGAADADEKAVLAKVASRDGYPGSALADPTLDDGLFDSRLVPAGFRHLFRLLDEPLGKLFRADLKRLGVGKHEKLARGHALYDLAKRIGGDLAVGDLDLYVTAAHPTTLMVELTEPLSLIIGLKLIDGAHELETRFYLGRLLKMVQCHMSLPMRLTGDDLGVLVGAVVRQFVPDFVPRGIDEKPVAAEAARLVKAIPKKMHGELAPFALECASEALDLKQIGPALVDAGNRAGLLCAGSMAASLTALKRIGDDGQLRALLRFSVSEELAELRRQAGTSVG